MRTLYLFFLLFVFISTNANAQFTVIAVPYRGQNPSIPHYTYSGHATVLKAVARTSNPSATLYYRWDADGNGTWDNVGTGSPVAPGNWYLGNCYSLDGKYYYPYLDPAVTQKKLYLATIEVAETVNLSTGIPTNSSFASYPVFYISAVPAAANANSANDEQLAIMREVAIDDGLWYLHKQLTRGGSGVGISGYLAQSGLQYSIAASAYYLRALTTNSHLPAYKPGTYVEYGTPMGAEFYSWNDFKWNNDPYSEDAVRIFNYLLANINIASIGSGAVGFTYTYSDLCEAGNAISALAYSGMTLTKAQVGDATYVKGISLPDIMQRFVNYLAYSQILTGTDAGGWGYSPGEPYATSYTTGGAILALISADVAMGYTITIPQTTKDKLAYFLLNFQRSDGSVQYMRSYPTSTFEPVGLFLAAAGWMGWNTFPSTDPTPIGTAPYNLTRGNARVSYDKYLRFIADNFHYSGPTGGSPVDLFALWSDGNYNSGLTNHDYSFSLHNTRIGISNIGPMPSVLQCTSGATINWYREISVDGVRGQLSDGSFTSAAYWYSYNLDVPGQTAMECTTITPPFFDPDPVAIGSATPMVVMAGCSGSENGKVSFSHNNSFHLNPNRLIADYQWMFEVPGNVTNSSFAAINWANLANNTFSSDGKAFHTTSRNAVVTYQFMKPGTYNAALRVVDDNYPAKYNIYILNNIVVNAPPTLFPVVEAGGPYKIERGNLLTLSGSAVNPNIACYPSDNLLTKWDLNNDGTTDFTSPSGTMTWAQISGLGIPLNTVNNVSFTAENSFGQATPDGTTLTICDVSVDLGSDLSITTTDEVTLDAGPGALSYLWSDGSTAQQLLVKGSETGTGTFTYSVQKTFPVTQCIANDQVEIVVSTTTGIHETSTLHDFSVYPNPVTDWLTITSESGFDGNSKVEILNSIGETVLAKVFKPGVHLGKINLEYLKGGLYVVRISSAAGEKNIKLIKK
jgi:hypothetical protein